MNALDKLNKRIAGFNVLTRSKAIVLHNAYVKTNLNIK